MKQDKEPSSYLDKRRELDHLWSQLEMERSSFTSHWRDLGDHIFPRRPRFTLTETNRGDRRNQKIINSTATLAARTLRAGMMSGLTSPARPWFRLVTPDAAFMELGSVKGWLHEVTNRMTAIFLKSNLYNSLPVVYGDVGSFATGCMMIEEDFDNVIDTTVFPLGSYMLANDQRGRVNVFAREFRMTVRQLVEKFASRDKNNEIIWDNFSDHVKYLWMNGNKEAWIDVRHVIKPNDKHDPRSPMAKHKKFESCYWEAGSSTAQGSNYLSPNDKMKYLRESGYDYFPVLAPRWERSAEDVYGTDCPGMTALGDIRALQIMEKRKAQAVEKMVNPPMVGPTSLRSAKVSILPGDVTFTDVREGQQGFRPAHEVNPRVNELLLDIQAHQERIRRAFFEDLFLMLSTTDRRDITAREIDERHEEKLLALGPVLEQLNQDLLDPLIDITYTIMERQGLIPEPPEEIRGVDLKVEYISIMAQAQKLVGISSVERFTQFAQGLATFAPSSLDKIDTDQILDVYSDILSLPPGIVRTDDDVEAMRAERARQAQAAQQAQALMNAPRMVRDLASAPMDGDSALNRMVDNAQAGALAALTPEQIQ